ncbi:conserved hypothetical protein [Histoplasma mississippiense (nom. inval.)]|uniref:conserved hypothetical protein n=1 Tax=Ajellomyces capsulatus (strain NAm1 / WU24) TaxID=2059318 RepID=UPI000157B2B8|nr:conserved hypothetical protein [Histoplasma mississippiense (nom. inval.)]EDN02289.1 conserved hypothetical protein [Histoplasma mississippiense (nom. inval.)]
MGCWLVVLACKFWNRYISHRLGGSSEASLLTGGYEPVDGADNDLAESDDELDPTSPLNGSPRASTTKRSKEHDGRIKLKGWKVFMLAAPACCDITGTTLMNVGIDICRCKHISDDARCTGALRRAFSAEFFSS